MRGLGPPVLVAALGVERAAVRGRLGGVPVLRSGVGPARASAAAAELAEAGPR
ncbi:MAG: hypothetical protein JWP64_3305, partial [Pseudonocardia sp.]|nr:hypothetical protein [Pseudonocardia sp.]